MSEAGQGAAPTIKISMDERSVESNSGCCAMNKNIAGAPNMCVTLYDSIAANTAPGSKCRKRTSGLPICNADIVMTFRPPMWKSGAAVSNTSELFAPNARFAFTLFQTILPCVSIAPLGKPVVPEVYMINRVSWAARATTSSSRGADAIADSSEVKPSTSSPTEK